MLNGARSVSVRLGGANIGKMLPCVLARRPIAWQKPLARNMIRPWRVPHAAVSITHHLDDDWGVTSVPHTFACLVLVCFGACLPQLFAAGLLHVFVGG